MKEKHSGLSTPQAEKILKQHGSNTLPEQKPPASSKLILSQFKSPLIYILVFAALVTLILQDFVDFTVISLAVIINSILGFFQERKAQNELSALKKVLTPRASVLRDGKIISVETAKIVPGDVVVLKTGEKIPADGQLIEAAEFRANEAILTGESEPISKGVSDRVFMGTLVSSGHGTLRVEKTGVDTGIGKIAQSLKQTQEEPTPLQFRLAKLSQTLALIVGFLTFSIFVIGLFKGQPVIQMFVTSVAIAVAAIPEGLVISLTVILALGMQRLFQQKALVRKLVVAETLGSTSVICIDKTGTLTEGKMGVVDWEIIDQEKALKAAVLCNNLADPTEVALWEKARSLNSTDPQKIFDQNPRIAETPFSSERKFMAVTVKSGEVFVKGAPELLLDWAKVTKKERGEWGKLIKSWSEEGLRLIALGYQPVAATHASPLQFLGLAGLSDPIRTGVKEAVKKAQEAGIKIKVITGDYRATAETIMKKLGFELKPSQIIEGKHLKTISPEDLQKCVGQITLFARTNPQQKLKIVDALQAKGEVVAMLGDGVNDAPALKKAEIGIVVGEASDVAKETADMVLLDSNFKTIIRAIGEGRTIFENIKKVTLYLLSDSFTEVLLIGGSLLLGLPLPILATQILWVNLIEDGLPGLALAFEKGERGVMQNRPRPKNEPIIDLEMKVLIFAIGLVTDFLHLGLFYYLFKFSDLALPHIRTIIFAALAVDSLLYVFSARSLSKNVWQKSFFDNRFLTLSVVIGFILLFASLNLPILRILLSTQPLIPKEWLLVLSLGLLDVIGIETVKRAFAAAKR